MSLQLNKLHIVRQEYGVNKGELYGKLEFAGPLGKMEVPMTEELSKEILAVCAKDLVRISTMAAEELTVDIINDVPQLEDQTDGEA